MSSGKTSVLGLNLYGADDRFSFLNMNRDNERLEALLGPVAAGYGVLNSGTRINSYNVMKAIRAAYYSGISVPEKTAMFFGDFDSAAYSTSDGALLMTEKHGYVFSDYAESIASGAEGDAATAVTGSTTSTGIAFSFEAPVSGYINSYELDIKLTAAGTSSTSPNQCRIRDFYVAGVQSGSNGYLPSITATTTRAKISAQLTAPVAVHKGDTISGMLIMTSTNSGAVNIYSAEYGVPYIKFDITPTIASGWLQTELNDLGSMGHSEARVYIQCLKDENGVIGASLIDEEGNELELAQNSSRTTVTKDGNTCIELCFTAPFNKEAAALKINADSNGGYADIYNYAVTVL